MHEPRTVLLTRRPTFLTPSRLLAAGAALAVVAFLAPGARAFPEYRLQAVKQLRLAPDENGRQVVDCTYCHVRATGGDPWNPFGRRLQAAQSGDFAEDLYKVLVANADSDGDTYEDVLEVFAGTKPGDRNSRPLVEKAFLKKNFEAAGGVKLYKP
ncbi:MAG TPA: hypothetical protein VNT60_09950 [Deinococcales bacterium]|nr:hypothetical protein [Deinococcales bacterium]